MCLRRNKWNIHTVYACPCAALCQLARVSQLVVPLESLLGDAGRLVFAGALVPLTPTPHPACISLTTTLCLCSTDRAP